MICKKLNAKIPEKTCVARQKAIIKQQVFLAKHGTKGNGPNWGHSGGNGPIMEYVSCVGCEIGLKLYEKGKTNGRKTNPRRIPGKRAKSCTAKR